MRFPYWTVGPYPSAESSLRVPCLSFQLTTSALEANSTRAGMCSLLAIREFLWKGAQRRLWTRVWDLHSSGCGPRPIACRCGLGAEAGGQTPPCRPCCRAAEDVGRSWAGWALSLGRGLARSPSPSAYASSRCTYVPTQTEGRSLGTGLFIKIPCCEFFALLKGSYIPFIVVLEQSCRYSWKNPVPHMCVWEARLTLPCFYSGLCCSALAYILC